MSDATLADRKHHVRRQALSRRHEMAALPGSSSDALALAAVWRRWLLQHPSSTHCAVYAAIRGELDCTPLCAMSRRLGRRTYYPRIRPGHRLVMAEVRDESRDLRPARWGILEPWGSATSLARLDVILVPGVLFDRWGGRLGFGGGYYDRLLSKTLSLTPRAMMIGVCRASALSSKRLPRGAHDQMMDAVLTPDGLISCNTFI